MKKEKLKVFVSINILLFYAISVYGYIPEKLTVSKGNYKAEYILTQGYDHLEEYQWYLKTINAQGAWEYFKDFSKAPIVRIGIFEEEKFSSHVEFKNNLRSRSYDVKSILSKIPIVYENSIKDSYYCKFKEILGDINDEAKERLKQELRQDQYKNCVAKLSVIDGTDDNKKGNVNKKSLREDNTNRNKGHSAMADCDFKDHPTNVTGIIASGHNNFGIKGICPFSKIIPLSISFDKDDIGENRTIDPKQYLIALPPFLAKEGPHLLNMSLEIYVPLESFNYDIVNDLRHSYRKNDDGNYIQDKKHENLSIPIFVAAGNKPAQTIDGLVVSKEPFIAVGATDKNNKVTNYTSKGSDLEIFAPGGEEHEALYTTYFFGTHDFYLNGNHTWEGGWNNRFCKTSASTPIITGVAGLMLAINQNLHFDEIKSILTNSGTYVEYPMNPNARIVNAKKSVEGAFISIIDQWKFYWTDKISNAYNAYYGKDSVVVRGVVLPNKKDVKYRVFSDQQVNIDDIRQCIDEFMDNKKITYSYSIDSTLPLKSFKQSMALLNKKYGPMNVNIHLDNDAITPQKTYIGGIENGKIIDTMEIVFYQSFNGKINESKTYSDKGWKYLLLKRDRTENDWKIRKEIWINDPI